MRKNNSIFLLILVTLFTFTIFYGTLINVNAGLIYDLIMDETFSSSDINRDNWDFYSNHGATITTGDSSLEIDTKSEHARVISTTEMLGGKGVVFEFDIINMDNFTGSSSYKWIGFVFGATTNGDSIDYAGTSNTLIFQNTRADEQAIFYRQTRNGVINTPIYIGELFNEKFENNKTIKIEVSPSGEIFFSTKSLGEQNYTNHVENYIAPTPNNDVLTDGFAGISFNQPMALNITNLKIYTPENPTKIFELDFSTNLQPFQITHPNEIIIGGGGELKLDNIDINRTVISKRPIKEKNIMPQEKFDFKFDIKIENLTNKRVGLLFGLEDSTKIVGDMGHYLYFEKDLSNLYFGLDSYNSLGNKTQNIEKILLGNVVNAYLPVQIEFDGTNININVKNNIRNFAGKIDGYFGFATENLNGLENNAICYIDNVMVGYNSYISPANKDLSYNFENQVIPSENDALIMSRAYNEANGGNGAVKLNNGNMHFDRTAEGSKFMFNYEYSNFDLIFDITWVQADIEYASDGQTKRLPPSSFFGIMINAPGTDSEHYSSKVNALFFNKELNDETWEKNNDKPMNIFTLGNLKIDNSNSRGMASYDFWDTTKNTIIKNDESRFKVVTVRLLVEDGIAKLYMRAENESVKHLSSNPVYTFTNVESNGYIAIVGSGQSGISLSGKTTMQATYQQTNFKIDNLSIQNKDLIKNIINIENSTKKDSAITPSEYENYTPVFTLIDGAGCSGDIVFNGGITGFVFIVGILISLRRSKGNEKHSK